MSYLKIELKFDGIAGHMISDQSDLLEQVLYMYSAKTFCNMLSWPFLWITVEPLNNNHLGDKPSGLG